MFPNKAQKLSQEITNAGLHCVGCQAATWRNLEAGMLGHGMTEEHVERLVDRLNALLMEQSDPNTITMTSAPSRSTRGILAEEGKEGWGIRLSEQMAGCSGFEYVLDYSEEREEDDEEFDSNGIRSA